MSCKEAWYAYIRFTGGVAKYAAVPDS